MRVALVHEFLTQYGGAERVLENFHEVFPEAPVFTLVYDEQKTQKRFADWDIRTSYLNALAKIIPYKWLLPLMPGAMESFDLSGFDLVLSDSSAFAKGVIVKKPTVHVCYCHTPTRYLWESMDEYVESQRSPGFIKFLVKHYLKTILKKWDYQAAQKPDQFIANSETVRKRIKKHYGRDSQVIYPPVDTVFFNGREGEQGRKGQYYFTASRLEPYKKIDLVIEAFNKLDVPLKVAGAGTEYKKLKIIRGGGQKSNIDFLGKVSDAELRALYLGAKAFVFPANEDAGIMVLESLACGTPVVGLNEGGTAEFVRDAENGVLFENQTAEEISRAVQRFEEATFDSEKVRESVLRYDRKEFKEKIEALIDGSTSLPASPQAWGEG